MHRAIARDTETEQSDRYWPLECAAPAVVVLDGFTDCTVSVTLSHPCRLSDGDVTDLPSAEREA